MTCGAQHPIEDPSDPTLDNLARGRGSRIWESPRHYYHTDLIAPTVLQKISTVVQSVCFGHFIARSSNLRASIDPRDGFSQVFYRHLIGHYFHTAGLPLGPKPRTRKKKSIGCSLLVCFSLGQLGFLQRPTPLESCSISKIPDNRHHFDVEERIQMKNGAV